MPHAVSESRGSKTAVGKALDHCSTMQNSMLLPLTRLERYPTPISTDSVMVVKHSKRKVTDETEQAAGETEQAKF